MRLDHYLNEEEKNYSYLDIEKDCKPYLSEMKNAKNFLMRYSLNYKFDTIVKYKLKRDREPVDTPKVLHDIMNDGLKERFGWYPRSNGLFTWLLEKPKTMRLPATSNKRPVLVFPISNYKYVYNPQIEDVYMEWDSYISEVRDKEIMARERGKETPHSAKISEDAIFLKWWDKYALPEYTNKNAFSAHLYSWRIECMINARYFYFIPQDLWAFTLSNLGIKIK